MNREEIEKRFWEQDFYDESMLDFNLTKIKSFFLDEILPEVLRDIIGIQLVEIGKLNDFERGAIFGHNAKVMKLELDAKEKYNITL